MLDRIVDFIDNLRRAGLTPSPSESVDALAAVSAAGVEREVLRESLSAALIKDHGDRPVFDEVFDSFFVVPRREGKKLKRPRSHQAGDGIGPGGEGNGEGRVKPDEGQTGTGGREGHDERKRAARASRESETQASRKLAERRRLLELPFREMGPEDVEGARELVEELGRRFRARWRRRLCRARRGRLDMRRTIRRAMSRGGVPVELLLRKPRPGKSDLLALVDLSYSTAIAAEFLLALLEPARQYFRKVTLLAYVDRPVEISFENGHVVPHEPLDLHARSDFGRVLRGIDERHETALARNTVLLVLGDARNNRRRPRADLLARFRDRVRSVIWLNPESEERWDTGDSVIKAYARYSDFVLAAQDLRTLTAALTRLGKVAF